MSQLRASTEFAEMSRGLVVLASDLDDTAAYRSEMFEREGPQGVRFLCRLLSGPILYVPMYVSPELARQWLELEGEEELKNRPSNRETLESYARDIENGNWLETGESITFDRAGTMWNGGHRCRAIQLAGKPIKSLVSFGISREAFLQMDSGRSRTNANYFHFLGEKDVTALNTAVGRLIAWDEGLFVRPSRTEKRTKSELRAYLHDHPEVRSAIKWGRQLARDVMGLAPAPAIISVVLLDRTGKPEEAEEFITKLRTGLGFSGEQDAAYQLRERLGKGVLRHGSGRGKRGDLTLEETLAYIFTAWNRRKEEVKILRIEKLNDLNFPQPDECRVQPRERRSSGLDLSVLDPKTRNGRKADQVPAPELSPAEAKAQKEATAAGYGVLLA